MTVFGYRQTQAIRNIAEELDPTFRAPGPWDNTLKTGPMGTEFGTVGNNEVEPYTVKHIVSLKVSFGKSYFKVHLVFNIKYLSQLDD